MNLGLILGGGLVGVLLFVVLLMKKSAKAQGHAEGVIQAESRHNEETNKQNAVVAEQNAAVVKQVEQTNEVHDRLKSDPVFAERVRTRFSRD